MSLPVKPGDIVEAAGRIAPWINRTPVLTCGTLDRMSGASLFFKCENFQKAGAFKARGAMNAVLSLSEEEAKKGVATHSSGNHAAALSLAAAKRGIPAYVVMPSNAPPVKVAAVRGYGGLITFCEPTLEARETGLAAVIRETGASTVHPYDDRRVVAGQGTAAMELLEDHGDLDAIAAPVGGGGLLSGTSIAAGAKGRRRAVYGCEPRNADDALRSFRSGKLVPSVNPDTIADGLRTSLCPLTLSIIMENVEDIVTVSEDEIVAAMRLVFERMKIIIEPSSAVAVAAALSGRMKIEGKRVGIIISGGNVDTSALPW
ncbi:MAG: pyridoxal-phosphate dependent enzyme [Candidatus Krumholzibacteria bacterium]|nr:pyridoxal-phosphate dependent enzyme [Candidatus Krumholzibacteria bacterium]